MTTDSDSSACALVVTPQTAPAIITPEKICFFMALGYLIVMGIPATTSVTRSHTLATD